MISGKSLLESNKGDFHQSSEPPAPSSRIASLGLGSYPSSSIHSTPSVQNKTSASIPFGGADAKFVPNEDLLYGSINCQGVGDNVITSPAYRTLLGDRNKSILMELRRLCYKDEDNVRVGLGSRTQSEVVGASILQDVTKYGLLKSTCISFRPPKSGYNDGAALVTQCATGLTNGSLCIHNFDMNDFSRHTSGDGIMRVSHSFYPARNARPATAVAWRPRVTNHVAIGLSSQRKMGRGDREFCCLMWDVEAQHRSKASLESSTSHIYSGMAPVNRFSHNTSVSALSWVMDAHILAVGTFQKIQLYDIRMVNTNTPPSSKSAHSVSTCFFYYQLSIAYPVYCILFN